MVIIEALSVLVLVAGACLFVHGLRLRRQYGALLRETEHNLDELRCLVKLEQHWATQPRAADDLDELDQRDDAEHKLVN